jgi:regulator of sirC expression with transglutaminase-like and TPR domain
MASAYHDLGAVYLQLGDNESACDALGQFVKLKPNHSRAPAIRDLMKKIKCP